LDRQGCWFSKMLMVHWCFSCNWHYRLVFELTCLFWWFLTCHDCCVGLWAGRLPCCSFSWAFSTIISPRPAACVSMFNWLCECHAAAGNMFVFGSLIAWRWYHLVTGAFTACLYCRSWLGNDVHYRVPTQTLCSIATRQGDVQQGQQIMCFHVLFWLAKSDKQRAMVELC
jgi:hypothetical protein